MLRGVKIISRRLGYGTAPMPKPDPKATEANCPLCGVYGPLSKMGWCYDTSCKSDARDNLRRLAAESGGTVEGRYYRIGDTELINLATEETCTEPISPIKHPDLCTELECELYARPQDNLCPEHRLQTNQMQHDAIRRQRQGKARRQKGRGHHFSNKIKGL